MSVRSVVRAIAGAIGGAVFGMIIVFVVAEANAAAIGDDGGGVLGLVMVMWGVPIALIVGAILGGRAAAAGRSSPLFRGTAIAAAVLVVFAIGLSVALPDNRPKGPDVDAQGCMISPRMGTMGSGKDSRYVVIYDRYCSDKDGHTVNVSVSTPSEAVRGPGNVLVLAGDATLEAQSPSHQYEVYADIRDSLHLDVQYDHRARVLSQASPVRGYEVALRPDLGIPRKSR